MKKIFRFISMFLFFFCFWYTGMSVQAAHPTSGSTTASNLIKSYESCRLTAYKAVPSETYYTIGWGHYGADVKAGMTITQVQADTYFNNDIKKFEGYLNTFLDKYNISITQAQYDALLSFTYNLGNRWASTPTFQLKTILINGCNNYTANEIRTAFTNWNKAGGVVLAGLTKRRNEEADLFLSDMNINHSASTVGNNPEGKIDVITGGLQSVRVAGWAFDRDNVSESIGIHVYIGTECIGAFMADEGRPDVNDAFACGVYHGFDKMLTIEQTGTQKIDVYAINIDGGNNVLIGSSTVEIQADIEQSVTGNNPEGNIDIITGDLQSVHVAGWAFDRDNVSEPIGIHVYIGTECIGTCMANEGRPDVNDAFACGMYHGFDKVFTIEQTGTQKIDVYAINIDGGNNILIGSSTVEIQADTEQPVISNVSISEESAEGYTISCNVIDNTEVDYVTIYTWTEEGGQDDLTSVNAIKDGNMYTCIINSSEHLGRRGTYVNHIYAYDKYGNCSSTAVNATVYYNSQGYNDTEIKNDTKIENIQESNANDKQTEQKNIVLKPIDLRINPIKKTIQIRKSFIVQIVQRYPKEWTELYKKSIKKVVYKSSRSSIASVNKKTGKVTEKKKGNTTIKTIIYFNSGKIAIYKTKVYVKK